MIALGPRGIVGVAAKGGGGTGKPVVWFGSPSGSIPSGPIPTLPITSQGNDSPCIGGTGGDPGVVCVEPGYYVKNASSADRLVRMSGGAQGVYLVPAGATGRLSDAGTPAETGRAVRIDVLNADCGVANSFQPGSFSLVTIKADGTATVGKPTTKLKTDPFQPSSDCGG